MTFKDYVRISIFTLGMLLAAVTPHAAELPKVKSVYIAAPERGLFLHTSKLVHMTQAIEAEGLKTFEAEWKQAEKEAGPMVVLIDSPGGFFSVGKQMLQYFEKEQKRGNSVVCVVTGQAVSMAFNLLSLCDVRLAVPTARFMFHAIFATDTEGVKQTPKNLRSIADTLEKDEAPWVAVNKKRLHMSDEEYEAHADNETIWTAQGLHERVYIDSLVEVKEDP